MALLSENTPDMRPFNVQLWRVLSCLTLPALRTLHLSGPNFSLVSLKALLLCSQRTLDALRIGHGTLSEAEYRETLPPIGMIALDEF